MRAGLVYTGNYSTSLGKIFKLPNIDKKAIASMHKIQKVDKVLSKQKKALQSIQIYENQSRPKNLTLRSFRQS